MLDSTMHTWHPIRPRLQVQIRSKPVALTYQTGPWDPCRYHVPGQSPDNLRSPNYPSKILKFGRTPISFHQAPFHLMESMWCSTPARHYIAVAISNFYPHFVRWSAKILNGWLVLLCGAADPSKCPWTWEASEWAGNSRTRIQLRMSLCKVTLIHS